MTYRLHLNELKKSNEDCKNSIRRSIGNYPKGIKEFGNKECGEQRNANFSQTCNL